MRSIKGFLLICCLFITSLAFAQAPQAISYQAILRNASGSVQANSTADLRFSILQGSVTGTAVYVETHSVTTDTYGSFNLAIGNGTPTTGVFASINWANGPYFLQTEMDTASNGSYMVLSTSQFLSVPYALYAERSGGCLDTLINNEVTVVNFVFIDTDNDNVPDEVSAELVIDPVFFQQLTSSVVSIKKYSPSHGAATSFTNWTGLSALASAIPMGYSNVSPGQTIVHELYFMVNGCQKLFRYEVTL